MDVSQTVKLGRKISILKTAYYSLKFRGFIIVGKGTKFNLEKGARIVMTRGRFDIGVNFDLPQSAYLGISRNGTLVLDGHVHVLKGSVIVVKEDARLSVGSGSFFNEQSKVICTHRISIGKNCLISWGVNIVDSDTHKMIVDGRASDPDKEVVIHDNVWIGANAQILKGVSVGSWSVIGAGAVVTKDVPEHCLSCGNPSEVVRDRVSWAE
jgi:tetrahydrodipicolinate N-succinyltransferase